MALDDNENGTVDLDSLEERLEAGLARLKEKTLESYEAFVMKFLAEFKSELLRFIQNNKGAAELWEAAEASAVEGNTEPTSLNEDDLDELIYFAGDSFAVDVQNSWYEKELGKIADAILKVRGTMKMQEYSDLVEAVANVLKGVVTDCGNRWVLELMTDNQDVCNTILTGSKEAIMELIRNGVIEAIRQNEHGENMMRPYSGCGEATKDVNRLSSIDAIKLYIELRKMGVADRDIEELDQKIRNKNLGPLTEEPLYSLVCGCTHALWMQHKLDSFYQGKIITESNVNQMLPLNKLDADTIGYDWDNFVSTFRKLSELPADNKLKQYLDSIEQETPLNYGLYIPEEVRIVSEFNQFYNKMSSAVDQVVGDDPIIAEAAAVLQFVDPPTVEVVDLSKDYNGPVKSGVEQRNFEYCVMPSIGPEYYGQIDLEIISQNEANAFFNGYFGNIEMDKLADYDFEFGPQHNDMVPEETKELFNSYGKDGSTYWKYDENLCAQFLSQFNSKLKNYSPEDLLRLIEYLLRNYTRERIEERESVNSPGGRLRR